MFRPPIHPTGGIWVLSRPYLIISTRAFPLATSSILLHGDKTETMPAMIAGISDEDLSREYHPKEAVRSESNKQG